MKGKISSAVLSLILVLVIGLGSGALIYFGLVDEYSAQILTAASINIIIALSLNLVSGISGQLALGHAGFMAIGAYTAASCVMILHWPLFFAVIAGGLMTSVFGFVIGYPTLKLSGDYLAIVTLGFGEIIRVILINLEGITGGAAGLKSIPSFTPDILLQPAFGFMVTFFVMALVIYVINQLMRSSYGRAILSVREDEISAGACGIPVHGYKMFAFTLSAFIAGIGGALYAPFYGYLNPTDFSFLKSVDFLIIVVFGGMGSITGTVISGYVLTILQESLRFLKDFRLVIYALILILIMLFRPQGLLGKAEFTLAGMRDFVESLFIKLKAFLEKRKDSARRQK